ncbi:hypothetical protein [Paractinoplanes maris]|uniref:hypothetical protein n=1 Tax=Paractinoplanes maris TaxID=1734446 RepID=UPI00202069B6|nr:hypothetical protein [Actinoplanes maris]
MPRVLAAERRRLRTVRSTWWFAAAAGFLTVGIGAVPAIGVVVGAMSGNEVEPTGGVLSGIPVLELLVAAFAVRAVTTDALMPTFTAVPRRTTVVIARAAVVSSAVLAAGLALTFGTFAAVHVVLRSIAVDLPMTAPGVARALAGAALHLAAVAALSVAAGWLLRGAVAALAAVLGVFYVLPILGVFLPDQAARVMPWLPSSAASALMTPAPAPGLLPPWAAALALVGYAGAALLAAALVVRRRDI